MSTTFANSIDSNPIYADRAEKDKDGNRIDTTYAKLADIPSVPVTDVEVNGTSVVSGGVASVTVPTATSDLQNDSGFITLSDVPAQQQADWTESDSSDPSYIAHKPNLAAVATSGDYNDLSNKPTIPSAQVNSDWDAESGVAAILNKPSLATVATSGSYTDLSNKPNIPEAQVNSDWDASTGIAAILNKPDLSIYAQSANLATVATSGSYNDLSDKPTIPSAQVNSDWDAASGVSQILNKPDLSIYAQSANLATVATTGDYADLSNKPTIPTETSDLTNDSGFITLSDVPAQQQADWTESDSSDPSYIAHKPNLAAVATSGQYSDLSGTPSIPTKTSDLTNDSNFITIADVPAQVQSDWTESDSSEPSYIANKPTLAAVATSGDYSDLSGTPSIPTKTSDLTNDSNFITLADVPAQVQADWTESDSSDPSYIANKPTLAAVATSGDYSDLSGTPTINNVPAVTSSDDAKVLKASYTGGVGSYSWENETGTTYSAGTGIDISQNNEISVENPLPASTSAEAGKYLKVDANGDPEWATGGGGGGGVNADWDETDPLEPSYIENKPTPKTLTAGTGISISEGVSTLTISSNVTAPVQDVTVDGTSVVSNGVAAITSPTVDQTYDALSANAQSGVAVASGISDAIGDLPTNLTSAQIEALKAALGVDETVLYSGLKSNGDGGSATYTLSELPTNFQIIKVYCCASDNTFPTSTTGNCGMAYFEWDTTAYTPPNTFLPVLMNGNTGTNFTQYWTSANVNGIRTTTWTVQGSLNSATSNAKWFHIYKIVGIHRIASN